MRKRNSLLIIFVILVSIICTNWNYNIINEQSTFENLDQIDNLQLSNGDVAIAWENTWGNLNDQQGSSVALDSSENVYVAGTTNGDMFVVKYNKKGEEQWSRIWGGFC